MMRLLISVRSSAEALLAARGGADFIDLKEPGQGALGGLPVATIRTIVAALRSAGVTLPVSATIGDLPMSALAQIAERVDAVGDCGVDYVKVGIERDAAAPAVLDALAACGRAIVPVFIADRGLDTHLLAHAIGLGFPALMLDTADKLCGSLFDALALPELEHFVRTVRASGALVGLAGALRLHHASALAGLEPDFAGFRSAVCATERSAALDAGCLRTLVATMRQTQIAA